MITDILIGAIGLFASYLFIKSIYYNQSLIKCVISTITVFQCSMILFGYFFDRLNIALFSIYTLSIFLLIIGLILLKNKRILHTVVNTDLKFIKGFIFTFVIGFMVHNLPSFPSLFPIGRNLDTFQHFAIVKYIVENNSLLFRNTSAYAPIPGLDSYLSTYPFGMHINIAFISRLLDIDPIALLYPFIVSIAALTAAAIYGIVVESKISGKFYGVIPALIILAFYLPTYMLRVMGWWPQVFGIFLTVMFLWLLMDYAEKPTISGLLPLILIEVAIIFSYIHWVLIVLLTFFLTLWIIDLPNKKKVIHFGIFSSVVSLLTFDYVLIMMKWAAAGLSTTYGTYIRFLPFDFFGIRTGDAHTVVFDLINLILSIFFTLSIFGAIKYYLNKNKYGSDKKQTLVLLFFISALLHTFALGVLVVLFDFRAYAYSKAYYLLTYPAAIFVFMFLKDILLQFNIVHRLKTDNTFKAIVLTMLVLFVFAAGQIMSLGVKDTGHQELAITPDQYDVALWVKNNLISENLTYMIEPPQSMWFYIASEYPPVIEKQFWGIISPEEQLEGEVEITSRFKEWKSSALKGDVVVILDTDKIDSDLDAFEVMYKKGNAVVLKNS